MGCRPKRSDRGYHSGSGTDHNMQQHPRRSNRNLCPKQKDQILENVREHLLRNFEALKRWMPTQGQLEWFEPQGGAVAFPRLKANASTEPLCRLLVTKYRTFTIPGYAFGMDRHLRIGFGGEAKELSEGLTRLGSAMNEMTVKPGLRV